MASFSRQARAPAVSAVVLLSALGLSSCSGSAQACTAIGWSNALIVQFEGESAEVSDLELCADPNCSSEDAGRSAELTMVELSPREGPDDPWRFILSGGLDPLYVRVLGAEGAVLTVTPIEPDWIRVGGSERCGGPHEATVTIEL